MYLCFDLGGTNIKAGMIDDQGKIKIQKTIPTNLTAGVDGVLYQFKKIEQNLVREIDFNDQKIQGIGVGIPGFVQMDEGFVLKAPNLGWDNIPIKEKLEHYFEYPVFVTNDANAAALGEMWQGAGQGKKDLLCLTLGTGIGAGIIIAGKLHDGLQGLAGEIGHFQVKPYQGRNCNCGKIGCLETEISGSALAFYGEEAVQQGKSPELAGIMKAQKKLTSKDIVKAAVRGDKTASEIIDKAAYSLGLALANIFLVIAPQQIIIGGGVAKAGEVLFKPLINWFNHFSLPYIQGEKLIVPARLGNDAGIVGLAQLVQAQLKKKG